MYPIGPGKKRGDVAGVRGTGEAGYPAMVMLAGHACTYLVRAGRTADGSVLLSLRVDPLEGNTITREDLAAVPVQRLAAAAVWAGFIYPADDYQGDPAAVEVDWSSFARPEPARTGRPVERGPEHYAEVAGVARAAWMDGISARDQIAERWDKEPQTADRWIRTARQMGLLETHAEVRAWRASGAPTGTDTGGGAQ